MAKQNIYLCQFSSCYPGARKILYYPYSVGLIWSYAKTIPEIDEAFNCKFFLEKKSFDTILDSLDNPALIGLSSYVWNHNYNLKLAELIKERYPNCLTVIGGPSVPYKDKTFLEDHKFIDFAVYHEGELAFTDLLLHIKNKLPKDKIRGIGFIDVDGNIVANEAERIPELDRIPSPYSTGLFDEITEEYKDTDIILNVVTETNRGCPYSCTFCDWGNGTLGKVHQMDICRTLQELDWFSENKIEYLHIADANFGIKRKKDLEIIEYAAKLKRETGFPRTINYTLSKKFYPEHLEIAKTLLDNQMMRHFTLSLQDRHEDVLEAIKRKNIDHESYMDIKKMCDERKIPMCTELMIPLPEQTFDTFMDQIEFLVKNNIYPHFSPTTILPGAEMADPEYQKKYGMKTVLSAMKHSEFVEEYEEVVIETDTMKKEEMNEALILVWLIDIFQSYGFADIIADFYCKTNDKRLRDFYHDMFHYFLNKPDSMLFKWFDPVKDHVNTKDTYKLYPGKDTEGIIQEIGYDHREKFFNELETFVETMIPQEYIKDLMAIQKVRQTHSYETTECTVDLDQDVYGFTTNNEELEPATYRIKYKPIEEHFEYFCNFMVHGVMFKRWKPLEIAKV